MTVDYCGECRIPLANAPVRDTAAPLPESVPAAAAADSASKTEARRPEPIRPVVQEEAGRTTVVIGWFCPAGGGPARAIRPGIAFGRCNGLEEIRPNEYDTVSRQHCRVDAGPAGCTLTDLGSTNGTWLNGEPLVADRPAGLAPGDRVRLADHEFVFQRTPACDS